MLLGELVFSMLADAVVVQVSTPNLFTMGWHIEWPQIDQQFIAV